MKKNQIKNPYSQCLFDIVLFVQLFNPNITHDILYDIVLRYIKTVFGKKFHHKLLSIRLFTSDEELYMFKNESKSNNSRYIFDITSNEASDRLERLIKDFDSDPIYGIEIMNFDEFSIEDDITLRIFDKRKSKSYLMFESKISVVWNYISMPFINLYNKIRNHRINNINKRRNIQYTKDLQTWENLENKNGIEKPNPENY